MTDPLDELMELKPTHASVLLIDPLDLAERAGRSARGARRRANALLAAMSVAAVALVVAVGALFLRPTQAMPAGSPSAAYSGAGIKASANVAPYTAERVAVALIVGDVRPDKVCLGDYNPGGTCTYAVKLAGVTWPQVPWRETAGSTSYARVTMFGTFDGTTFSATKVSEPSGLELGSVSVSRASISTTSLMTCDAKFNADSTVAPGSQPLSFPGLEAYWMDVDQTWMVATSGDLAVAVSAVTKAGMVPACVGSLPQTGPLADLVAAIKKLKAANVDGVFDARVSLFPSGPSIQVSAAANVPGLRERIAQVVGSSVAVTIMPAFCILR
jgi:hypothetical protein